MKKRALAILLTAVLLLALLAGCAKTDGKDGDALTITYWIPRGEDSTYYMSYDENPGVKYLETLEFNGRKIDLKFTVPVSGSEQDNFNTLLMTDEYCDILDMMYSSMTPAELYEDGYIWDLTPYIDQYMPNYKAMLEMNPDIAGYATTDVNGERKNLALQSICQEVQHNFMGLMYRRDWIAKYGKNPSTGAAFTGGFSDPADPESWQDDILFPSWYNEKLKSAYLANHPEWNGADPVYISDWEWMFDIFNKAIAEQGIADGYCLSPYFKGYYEDGGLCSSFGGGAPSWYKDKDGNTQFGGDSDSLRAYLQCMNAWYEKGCLDKGFAEHSSDSVFAIDTSKVHMGKVGCWIGRRMEYGNQMDIGMEGAYTDGIYVLGARLPINDIYGGAEQQMKEPYCQYQYSRLRNQIVVTKKVSEENLPTVLAFIDFMVSREGGIMCSLGLTKEQYATIADQDSFYEKMGVKETGTYTEEQQSDGSWKYTLNPVVGNDTNSLNACCCTRITINWYPDGVIRAQDEFLGKGLIRTIEEWDYYLNTGYIEKATYPQMTAEESAQYSKVHANLDTFMSSNIPKFIDGSLDVDSDADWANYCKMLNKYGPGKVTAIFQRIFDEMK